MPLEFALQYSGQFPDPGPWKAPVAKKAILTRELGLKSLPNQVSKRIIKDTFQFNVMVVGETGLGKSTFLNTLFNTDLYKLDTKYPQQTDSINIKASDYELEEGDVILHLRLIDTVGFGDRVDRSNDLEPILSYINDQYEAFYQEDRHITSRKGMVDNRVHLCFYFITPSVRGLKELDIITMKALGDKVNLVPVIAKSDTLTIEEKELIKKNMLEDFAKYHIKVFPNSYEDHEPIPDLEKHIPFTVVGSEDYYEVNKRSFRGRQFRWGYVDVEDPRHSDFIHLRELIMSHCLEELIDFTHTIHYAEMRAGRLTGTEGRRPDSILLCDEFHDENMKQLHEFMLKEMSDKEEALKQQFLLKVKEAENALRVKEENLQQQRNDYQIELENEQEVIQRHKESISDLLQKMSIRY
ncbi:Septin-domain-containing protein [Pilobolus umbonatus]|nr:Septin-domain-containing protein [Pilobolus umbonatus]